MSKDYEIALSEHFYSLQGEGPTMGRPAVFLRLKTCNLMCGGAQTVFDKRLHDGATWRCDTIETWMRGNKISLDCLSMLLLEKEYVARLKAGAHLIITGGEPMLQQGAIVSLLDMIYKDYDLVPYVEIETNGTILPVELPLMMINQVNCSPKLSNSGMAKVKRYRLETLDAYAKNPNTIWKFVVSSVQDWMEIEDDFLGALPIRPQDIWLMPAASDREELITNSVLCAELAKENGCNYSTRLQVEIWNQTVGV